MRETWQFQQRWHRHLLIICALPYRRGPKAASSKAKRDGSSEKARRAPGGECSPSCSKLWALQKDPEIGSEAFAPKPEPGL